LGNAAEDQNTGMNLVVTAALISSWRSVEEDAFPSFRVCEAPVTPVDLTYPQQPVWRRDIIQTGQLFHLYPRWRLYVEFL
jgi:hypothetical protein